MIVCSLGLALGSCAPNQGQCHMATEKIRRGEADRVDPGGRGRGGGGEGVVLNGVMPA